MRNAFTNTIVDACKERDDIFIISGDAGLGVFDEFKEQYSGRFLNLGIAEQNMIGFAGGLAMTGHKVCLYNIIPFLLYRCYEQVRNDICYQELPVVLTGIGSGVTYALQGMTHYSIEDIGIARTLPNLTVISPIDPVEAKLSAEYSLKSKNPVYVRLAKRGEPVFHSNEDFDITMPQVLRDGEEIALLFHGTVSQEVMKAYDELVNDGIHPMLVSVPMLQPLNDTALLNIVKNIKRVVSVEEHYENSGLGNILSNLFSRLNIPMKLKRLGIPYGFIHDIKDQNGMREHFGISAAGIVKAVSDTFK